jgi:hypothetical protein
MESELFIGGRKVLFALVMVLFVGCSPSKPKDYSNLKQPIKAFQAVVPEDPVVSVGEWRERSGSLFRCSVVKDGGDVAGGVEHTDNAEGLLQVGFCERFYSIRKVYLDAQISDPEIISAYTRFERAAQLCMEIWGYCDAYLYPVPGRSQAKDLADGRPVSQITKEIRADLGIELTGSPSREWIALVLKETARRSEALLKLL